MTLGADAKVKLVFGSTTAAGVTGAFACSSRDASRRCTPGVCQDGGAAAAAGAAGATGGLATLSAVDAKIKGHDPIGADDDAADDRDNSAS